MKKLGANFVYRKSFDYHSHLKLVSAIFYQMFIFSSNHRPSETMKKCFFFHLKITNLCNFFPSFPHFPDSKGQMEVE